MIVKWNLTNPDNSGTVVLINEVSSFRGLAFSGFKITHEDDDLHNSHWTTQHTLWYVSVHKVKNSNKEACLEWFERLWECSIVIELIRDLHSRKYLMSPCHTARVASGRLMKFWRCHLSRFFTGFSLLSPVSSVCTDLYSFRRPISTKLFPFHWTSIQSVQTDWSSSIKAS